LPDVPPELFATVATMFQRLGLVIIVTEYFGLNGHGSISHAARALSDEKFGMSAIARGTCRCRRWLSGASRPEGGNAHA
jgi:hypothetical protein